MHLAFSSSPSFLTVLLPFIFSAFCALGVAKIGQRLSLVDTPNSRSSHSKPTPRGGGIGIWLSFVLAPYFLPILHSTLFPPCSASVKSFGAIAGFVGLLGITEDRFNLPARIRLAMQVTLSAVTVYLFIPPGYLMSSVFIFLPWVVIITGTANFYNFMDGINGIAGLTGIVGFGLMALFSSIIIHDYEVMFLSVVIVGSCLGFLFFNFPRAMVFMGDVGSIFLGFVYASFVLKLSTNIEILLCLSMFLCTFYADATITIYKRWRMGENLMEAHRRHLYQYMSNELRLPHWKVSMLYATVQLAIGILAIWAYKTSIIWQIVLIITYGLLFVRSYEFMKGKTQGISENNDK